MQFSHYFEKLYAKFAFFAKYVYLCKNYISMGYNEVIKKLKKLGAKILPPDARLFLYGSRARGDFNDNSDWDLLLLLNRPKKNDDYEKIAYPLMELGFDLGQYFSVHTYSNDEWDGMSFLPFYKNVERDKIVLV